MRSSYNERIRNSSTNKLYYNSNNLDRDHVYHKSNGSLDLESGVEVEMMSSAISRNPSMGGHGSNNPVVRRDFGSHGAIDSLSSGGSSVMHHRQYYATTTDESLDSTASSGHGNRKDNNSLDDSPKMKKNSVNSVSSGFFNSKETSSNNKSQKGLFKKFRSKESKETNG
jgi:hypothetical protein